MGYSILPSSTYINIVNQIESTISISTVSGTKTLNDIVVPTLRGALTKVSGVAYIHQFQDTSGAVNYLEGTGQIDIEYSAGNWTPLIHVPAGLCYVPANGYADGTFTVYGYVDIKTLLNTAGTYGLRWSGAVSHGDNLFANAVQIGLIFYFE